MYLGQAFTERLFPTPDACWRQAINIPPVFKRELTVRQRVYTDCCRLYKMCRNCIPANFNNS